MRFRSRCLIMGTGEEKSFDLMPVWRYISVLNPVRNVSAPVGVVYLSTFMSSCALPWPTCRSTLYLCGLLYYAMATGTWPVCRVGDVALPGSVSLWD